MGLIQKIKDWWLFEYRFSLVNKLWWKLQHRFNPKHQYNKINNLNLKAGYYDPDIRIKQAMFELFCEWKESVEETVERSGRHTEWFYLCEAY